MTKPQVRAPRTDHSELIVDYVAGKLEPGMEAAFERHIESCAWCRAEVAQQEAVWAILDEWREMVLAIGCRDAG
jgi:anti-sigma factor RsiW